MRLLEIGAFGARSRVGFTAHSVGGAAELHSCFPDPGALVQWVALSAPIGPRQAASTRRAASMPEAGRVDAEGVELLCA